MLVFVAADVRRLTTFLWRFEPPDVGGYGMGGNTFLEADH
jgi:hypothetical protein